MEKLQKLQKAKFYLEMLACSMDPITQEFIESEVLQKREVKDVLTYVADILEELIGNNGEVINVSKPIDFQVSRLNKHAIKLSDKPIQIASLMTRINKQVDTRTMRRLGASKISGWLIGQGYLVSEKVSVIKEISQLAATESSENFGIVVEEKLDEKTGEIKPCILLTRKAQEYIVENLETILGEGTCDDDNTDIAVADDYSMKGCRWSKQEDERLIREYAELKLDIPEIAKLHNRKKGGIHIRLKKLGLIG